MLLQEAQSTLQKLRRREPAVRRARPGRLERRRCVSWPCGLTALSGRWTSHDRSRCPTSIQECSSTWNKSCSSCVPRSFSLNGDCERRTSVVLPRMSSALRQRVEEYFGLMLVATAQARASFASGGRGLKPPDRCPTSASIHEQPI